MGAAGGGVIDGADGWAGQGDDATWNGHQLTVPAQQRRGRDQEGRPPFPWQEPRRHGQRHPILRGVAWSGDLPANHHQLVPQHGYFNVLRIRRRAQADQVKEAPDDHKRQCAHDHDRQPAGRVVPAHRP